jgi:hypothetical protein
MFVPEAAHGASRYTGDPQMEQGRRRPSGLVVGSLIGTSFGLVFILANSGDLPPPWPAIVRAAGSFMALLLLIGIVVVARRVPSTVPGNSDAAGFMGRGYRIIVGAEVIALFGGLALINGVLHRSEVAVAWVAVVVGVHFIGLARVWRMPLYTALGTVQTLLGVAGFLLYAFVASSAVGLVSGVGSGVALFATVGYALMASLRAAAA